MEYGKNIYMHNSQLVFGFHGCDLEVKNRVLAGECHLQKSVNDYDWLGNGIYFWLNDPNRAMEWAKQSKKVKIPAVIGAVIDLGECLNFSERASVEMLKNAYTALMNERKKLGLNLKLENTVPDAGGFNLIRKLDCAVIEKLHSIIEQESEALQYETVYGYFQEGKAAYEGAGIMEKTHVQICVRNIDNIKCYFDPIIDKKSI